MTRPLAKAVERILTAAGLLCFAWYGVQHARVFAFQRMERTSLEHAFTRAGATTVPLGGRVGRLGIPRVHLSAMVMEGDDDPTLARAIGHLADTPLPWEYGNAVMAGHRDTFFRPLKDIRLGDEIELITDRGTLLYHVKDTRIVMPDDVSVLAPTSESVLTLVTCYPFNFVGAAPKRFIVRAERQDR